MCAAEEPNASPEKVSYKAWKVRSSTEQKDGQEVASKSFWKPEGYIRTPTVDRVAAINIMCNIQYHR